MDFEELGLPWLLQKVVQGLGIPMASAEGDVKTLQKLMCFNLRNVSTYYSQSGKRRIWVKKATGKPSILWVQFGFHEFQEGNT